MTMIHIYKDPMLYILGFQKAVNESAQNMVNREPLKTQNTGQQPQTSSSEIQKALETTSFFHRFTTKIHLAAKSKLN